jgi:predicted transcriptional regulator YheO
MDLINDTKEEIMSNEGNLNSILKDKNEQILEVLNKMKNSLEDDITKAKVKIAKEVPQKNSEMIEWLKRQINELQPFKNKVMFLDNKTAQYEANIKILQNKFDLANDKVSNLEKLVELKDSKNAEVVFYVENLEAKLSDVKDFVFRNCSDQLDNFNASFKNYYTK